MTGGRILSESESRALAPGGQEMSAFDDDTIQQGTPGLTLMERAGSAIARQILADSDTPSLGKEIIVFCGPGNNGGDGLVIARHLLAAGIPPVVVLCASGKYSEDFLVNLKRISSYKKIFVYGSDKNAPGALVAPGIDEQRLRSLLNQSKLVIDALLGVGQSGAPRGIIAELARSIVDTPGKRVIAIDVPTGVDASTGAVYAPAIPADKTFTIEFHKRGLWQYPARSIAGQMIAVPIGISASVRTDFSLLTPGILQSIHRSVGGHKGDAGAVLVIGGSKEMPGAPLLSAHAALMSGAGIVRLCVPQGASSGSRVPEIMHVPVSGVDSFSTRDSGYLRDVLASSSALVIGPGLGISADVREFVLRILELAEIPVVIDADALTILSGQLMGRKEFQLKPNWVLTPHPGEFARLMGISASEVQQNRFKAFSTFGQSHSPVLVLKGAGTLVGVAGCGWIQTNGNPFMATAGCGDVLSGIIAAFIAQGLLPLDAARLGVHIHGMAGDRATARTGGVIAASDVISELQTSVSEFLKVTA